jgi:hypothetical protein
VSERAERTDEDVSTGQIKDSPAVKHWFDSARHHEDPAELQEALLAVLADFCAFTGKTPEELVAGCFLRKKATGDKFVSAKARLAMNATIAEFIEARGWTDREAVVNANRIRGFLIHNGVMIQGGAWTGPR